ncbi:MAG: glutathione S-transferase family protein [Myxococcales bacterium]|nr:glutathione S-transferase family protein [Myxococcales bacterium]MDD9964688.1 glutathione S-transferase family protein [Myxococcales bacterium]
MIKLYSAQRCPYALRTRLALQEKGLDYEHVEIDLRNKPAEFARISRYGKVPALFDGDRSLYESSIINEYLDEQYPEPPLMPEAPGDRAYARIWIDFANTRLMPASARIASAKTEDDKRAARDTFGEHMAMVGGELGDGPWLLGTRYSLVEVTYAPFYARKERYRGIDIPDNVLAWLQRIGERPAYVRTGGLEPRKA